MGANTTNVTLPTRRRSPRSAADTRFVPLPHPETRSGQPRRTGVELEFGGLAESTVVEIVQSHFGGTASRDARTHFVEADCGTFEIYLDSAIGKDAPDGSLTARGRELGRAIVPLELVAPPLATADLPKLQQVAVDLRHAGVTGTDGGLLLGFGMHLNIATRSTDMDDIYPTIRAYALLEDWLRGSDPIDLSRRILPFVDPYPRSFLGAVAETEVMDFDALASLYLQHNRTRNRGLDLLPILAEIDEPRVREIMGDEKIGPRPAFHYRLPDCRLDQPQWSIAYDFNRWGVIEAVAAEPEVLADLAAGWQRYHDRWTTMRGDWRAWTNDYLRTREFWHWEGRG
ncbi:amidoligase family protein [Algicella marina]|uniref:amidoligase family protein n=1 Tax=Algicella marina TaxID=2683284 RepID=UPI00137A2132|nr:amidoligase family protein [Algicella marina]